MAQEGAVVARDEETYEDVRICLEMLSCFVSQRETQACGENSLGETPSGKPWVSAFQSGPRARRSNENKFKRTNLPCRAINASSDLASICMQRMLAFFWKILGSSRQSTLPYCGELRLRFIMKSVRKKYFCDFLLGY